MIRKRDIGIHFIGIGGIGMSGIARIAAELEYPVSGSDLTSGPIVQELASIGCDIFHGHDSSHIANPDVVVISSAIKEDNPELAKARERNIPVISRAKMLGILMNSSRGIAIAGTHGKTTTSAMVSTVLQYGGLDPTAVIGGYTHEFNSNAKLGTGDFFVAEADESDGSLLELNPEIAIVNNIDNDHMDFYGSVEKLHETFRQFIAKVPSNGMVALSIDDKVLMNMSRMFTKNTLTFAIENSADLNATNIRDDAFSVSFDVLYRGRPLGSVTMPRPGLFNVYNALAAISVGLHVGLPFKAIAEGLAQFRGVKRRFDILKRTPEMIVIDDYAHHPSEIRATLSAIRSNHNKRVIGVFQPHRYSRMKHLAGQFGECFDCADEVVVTDIYSAGELPIPHVTSELVMDSLKAHNQRYVEYIPNLDDIPKYITNRQQAGDLVVTLGAGDVWKVAHTLAEN